MLSKAIHDELWLSLKVSFRAQNRGRPDSRAAAGERRHLAASGRARAARCRAPRLSRRSLPQACGVLLWKDDITESVVDLWRARGMKVIAWTVNRNEDKERLRLLNVPCMTDSLTEEEAPEAD